MRDEPNFPYAPEHVHREFLYITLGSIALILFVGFVIWYTL